MEWVEVEGLGMMAQLLVRELVEVESPQQLGRVPV